MPAPSSFAYLFVVVGVSLCANSAEVRYAVRALVPDSPIVASSGASGINQHGDVAGSFWTTEGIPRYQLYLYLNSGGFRDLGAPGTGSALASAINNSRQIALRAHAPSGATHVFRWSEADGFEDLGGLYGSTYSEVGDINNSGEIIGSADQSNRTDIIFRYTDETGLEPLGGPLGIEGGAWGNNDQGWITGKLRGGTAFLFRPGIGMTNIATGVGAAVNNRGVVAGTAGVQVGSLSAFIHRDGSNKLLGTLGGLNNDAFGINDFDVVVGCAELLPWFPTSVSGFVWTDREGMLDLNSLIGTNSGWNLTIAGDINNSGQIVGYGIHNGKTMAYRLDPIPPTIAIQRSGTSIEITWSPPGQELS